MHFPSFTLYKKAALHLSAGEDPIVKFRDVSCTFELCLSGQSDKCTAQWKYHDLLLPKSSGRANKRDKH